MTNQERLSPDQKAKYEIYEALSEYTSGKERASDLESLRIKLKKDKIDMQLHEKDGKRIGISFAKGDYKFSGVQMDKVYSVGKLEEKFVREQKQELKQDLSRSRGRGGLSR